MMVLVYDVRKSRLYSNEAAIFSHTFRYRPDVPDYREAKGCSHLVRVANLVTGKITRLPAISKLAEKVRSIQGFQSPDPKQVISARVVLLDVVFSCNSEEFRVNLIYKVARGYGKSIEHSRIVAFEFQSSVGRWERKLTPIETGSSRTSLCTFIRGKKCLTYDHHMSRTNICLARPGWWEYQEDDLSRKIVAELNSSEQIMKDIHIHGYTQGVYGRVVVVDDTLMVVLVDTAYWARVFTVNEETFAITAQVGSRDLKDFFKDLTMMTTDLRPSISRVVAHGQSLYIQLEWFSFLVYNLAEDSWNTLLVGMLGI